MRTALPIVLAVMMALVGCARRSDQDSVEAALQDDPFFRALGAVPQSGANGYQPDGVAFSDGDTSIPVEAWRNIHEPDIDYEITVTRPYADVDLMLTWPCTLFVVYTDLPNTAIRDTVVKPAPEIGGDWSARFEFDGNDWQLIELSVLDAEFDSAVDVISLDSIQVSVTRAGEPIEYPTLTSAGRMSLDPYAYTLRVGDSVHLRLWETHAAGIEFSWAYLHGPPEHRYDPFALDPQNGSWTGTWVIGRPTESTDSEHWVWFEVIDLDDDLFEKYGPDRSVLWGVPYIVE